MKIDNWIILIILFLAVFDVFIWGQIVFSAPNKNTEVYFLDVGQGDSELAVLPGNVKILIDAGPNRKVLDELTSALSPFDRYIDLVVLSHPQLDHFAGLIDVLKRYQVGAFVFNGRRGETAAFGDLEKIINENKIPIIILGEKDKIKYQDSRFDVLSPSKNLLSSAELNDTTLVLRLLSQNAKILFTGDIDSKIENYLAEKYELDVDVLKIAHHGSKFSSSEEFLRAATPKLTIIEVGKNSYGHPTEQVLNRLALIGAQIFRTDKDGTIKLVLDNGRINIFEEK
ncbi:MAG: MBL fold metallo-hydrolase [Patescibacteria group bacterium]